MSDCRILWDWVQPPLPYMDRQVAVGVRWQYAFQPATDTCAAVIDGVLQEHDLPDDLPAAILQRLRSLAHRITAQSAKVPQP